VMDQAYLERRKALIEATVSLTAVVPWH